MISKRWYDMESIFLCLWLGFRQFRAEDLDGFSVQWTQPQEWRSSAHAVATKSGFIVACCPPSAEPTPPSQRLCKKSPFQNEPGIRFAETEHSTTENGSTRFQRVLSGILPERCSGPRDCAGDRNAEIRRVHRLRPASGRDAGCGTLEACAPIFLRATARMFRAAGAGTIFTASQALWIISVICLVAMPMGRSSGTPAQASSVVSRSP